MRLKFLFVCLAWGLCLESFATSDSTKHNLSILGGVSGSWWKYNRGMGQGWDRSDFVKYYEVDLAYHRKIKKYQIGLLGTYGAMDEQNIEEFNDKPYARAKTTVSVRYIQFLSIGGEVLRTVVSSPRYNLLIGAGVGTFYIKTTYPFVDTFGAKIYWNGFVKHQVLLGKNCFLTLKMTYEKKHIFVPDGMPDEHHELFKTGVQLGIEKNF